MLYMTFFRQYSALIELLYIKMLMHITGSFLYEKRHSRITHLSRMFLILLNFVLKELCEKSDYEKLWAVRKHFFIFFMLFSSFSDSCKTCKAYFLSIKLRWLFYFTEMHISVEDIETKCWVSQSYCRVLENFLWTKVILCCICHWRTELLSFQSSNLNWCADFPPVKLD